MLFFLSDSKSSGTNAVKFKLRHPMDSERIIICMIASIKIIYCLSNPFILPLCTKMSLTNVVDVIFLEVGTQTFILLVPIHFQVPVVRGIRIWVVCVVHRGHVVQYAKYAWYAKYSW